MSAPAEKNRPSPVRTLETEIQRRTDNRRGEADERATEIQPLKRPRNNLLAPALEPAVIHIPNISAVPPPESIVKKWKLREKTWAEERDKKEEREANDIK